MIADFEAKIQNPKSKVCLVTGATGVVGVPLVYQLIKKGHAVKVLARREIAINLFPQSVQIVRGDLHDLEALEKAVDGADWIFHLAAKLHVNNPAADLHREYYETNVIGTKKIVAAAIKQKIEKVIFFSTINVYGASDGKQIFDERDKTAPKGFYAESKAAAEKLILAEDFGVVLRLAAVYGSRMKGNYVRLLESLRRNRFMFIGEGSNRRTLIHQEDAALAAIRIAEKGAGNSIYNATDNSIHTFSEIIAAISTALEKNAPRIHLPLLPIQWGIGFAEDVSKLIKVKLPVDRSLLEKLVEDVAVSGTKLRDELGFYPQFDLQKGWRETVSIDNKQQLIVSSS